MEAKQRGRKPSEIVETREEIESVPPPARKKRERHELDPEALWDSGADESEKEDEADDEEDEKEEWDPEAEDSGLGDIDDWDHPLRRLKIN